MTMQAACGLHACHVFVAHGRCWLAIGEANVSGYRSMLLRLEGAPAQPVCLHLRLAECALRTSLRHCSARARNVARLQRVG